MQRKDTSSNVARELNKRFGKKKNQTAGVLSYLQPLKC